MFWTLMVITLLPVNNRPPDGTFSTYEVISQHEQRVECEMALYSFVKKYSATNKEDKNKKIACLKTDELVKRLADSASH